MSRAVRFPSTSASADAANATTLFVAKACHELRTPLNAIGGLAHLLLELQPTDQQRIYLQQMQVASQHAAMLLDEMLDLQEFECGTLSLHEQGFELSALIEETLPLVRQLAWSKGVDVDVHLDAGLGLDVMGDAGRLRNIVLSCAARAVGVAGTSRLEMRLSVAERGVDYMILRFDLSRAGASLDGHEIEKLMGDPVQPDSGVVSWRALGSGLWISRANARLMHGELGLDSDAVRGLNVWFTARLGLLPAADEPAPPLQQALSALGGKQILIVEDDPLAREVSQHLLERVGVLVHLACNGEQAIAAAKERHFDAILMDIQMPIMDGLQATRIIRERLGLKALPVIAVTGNVLEKDRADCADAGITDFLAKPVDARRLWSSLAWCIAQAQAAAGT